MKRIRISVVFYLLFISMSVFVSCSQEDVLNVSGSYGRDDPNLVTRGVDGTLIDEVVEGLSGWHYSDLYVDIPGNLYGVYSKSYLDMVDLTNEWHEISQSYLSEAGGIDIGGKPTYGFCRDINENTYFITSSNELVKVDRVGQLRNLSDKFPTNTVFLGITSAQVNGNVFVSTAQGDGSDNPWQSYSSQTIYKIAGNGNVTMIAENIQAPIVPNAPYDDISGGDTYTFKMFVYTSVLSKRQGANLYGLDSNGKYYMVNTNSGEVTYYIPKVPIQFLTAGTSYTRALALSGRQILELRPNAATDLVIGTLPDSIPEDATIINFLVNADATIFYVVAIHEYTLYGVNPHIYPIVHRLRLNNTGL